jgi:hypothetical protein
MPARPWRYSLVECASRANDPIDGERPAYRSEATMSESSDESTGVPRLVAWVMIALIAAIGLWVLKNKRSGTA